MEKTFFVVSDIEMGQRDIMDDFTDDDIFAQFIDEIGQNCDEVTLILNGDIFDFLKMPYRDEHTRYISEEVSTWKLERIFEAHPKVFSALRAFARGQNHRIFFVIGNHDFDLVWPKIQTIIRSHLIDAGHPEVSERIGFDFVFDDQDFHAEHGHTLDPFFQHDLRRPFVFYKGQKLLNLPVGCQLFFSHLAHFKRRFPKEEQLYPRGKVKDYHPEYTHAIKEMFWHHGWKVALGPLSHLLDPTYRVRYWPFFRHILKYGLDFVDDERFLADRIDEIVRRYPAKKFFVLSHTHVLSEFMRGDARILTTDTWRDEYNVLEANHPKKPKSYAYMRSENGVFTDVQLKLYVPDSQRKHRMLVPDPNVERREMNVADAKTFV